MLSFIFGLLSLLTCQLFAIPAWMIANSYIASCQAWGEQPDTFAVVGRILALVSLVLLGLGVFVVVAVFLAASLTTA